MLPHLSPGEVSEAGCLLGFHPATGGGAFALHAAALADPPAESRFCPPSPGPSVEARAGGGALAAASCVSASDGA